MLIAWEAKRGGVPVLFSEILAGKHDSYLQGFFNSLAEYPYGVRLRAFHEPNGNWYPWSINNVTPAVASTAEWVAAWRYLVKLQRTVGGHVQWVWCVNNQDSTGTIAESYYPGADYVDVLGIDAYNGGVSAQASWAEPYELLHPMYIRLTRLNARAPVAVCEIGCRESVPGEGHTKAQWLTSLLQEARLPRIDRVNYFSKATWALDTSPSTLAAARQMASPF